MAQPPPEPMRFPQIAAIAQASLDGRLDALCVQLDNAIAGVVSRLNDVGGSGSVSMTLGFKATGNQIEITASLKRTRPERDSRAFSAFVDRDGTLYEENPRQLNLPLTGSGPVGVVAGSKD